MLLLLVVVERMTVKKLLLICHESYLLVYWMLFESSMDLVFVLLVGQIDVRHLNYTLVIISIYHFYITYYSYCKSTSQLRSVVGCCSTLRTS